MNNQNVNNINMLKGPQGQYILMQNNEKISIHDPDDNKTVEFNVGGAGDETHFYTNLKIDSDTADFCIGDKCTDKISQNGTDINGTDDDKELATNKTVREYVGNPTVTVYTQNSQGDTGPKNHDLCYLSTVTMRYDGNQSTQEKGCYITHDSNGFTLGNNERPKRKVDCKMMCLDF